MSAGENRSSGAERRVCLLTGAGGTLGDTFCRRFAADYDIVAVCRTRAPGVPSQLESYLDPLQPAAELPENAARVHVVYADLEQPGQVERVVELALARFGRIDLLVNNAALAALHPHGVADGGAALRDVERIFRVNVAVPLALAVLLVQQFWRDRQEENRAVGRNVVNVSSLSGSRVYPHRGQAVYAASKAALTHLTRQLGAEFATYGVRVNAVAPTSFPALVSTEAVADAIVRLDREPVTGQVLALGSAQS
ncbi:SDR family oxidoreductase [Jatrophihabitans cynanchi]|uniref:SDR family oxidoreductase n=1 Tax=Jatrophihabitans cynanchi TaxID=2944128 RepID=A0ABY7K2T1_9ACTN|nr:SDR family NAD(P)-dependent oxidoreductase [Jatrophihabitans sp. SB3-54]WAX57441.1 SDR family oxidoreductase [Jatrophihabitans sp. SB3-54]